MSKISELSDGGALQSTDYLIAVRSGGNVKVQPNGTVTGTTGSFSGNVTFADNAKAIFGAGSDLQIYHDGLNSYMGDFGTGDLYLRASTNLYIGNSAGSASFITATDGGAVDLRYNGSAKLATTATGIDVTGTVTADGLTVNTNVATGTLATLKGSTDFGFTFSSNAVAPYVQELGVGGGEEIALTSGGKTLIRLEDNNDISFYEDTGTTAKLAWSASNERLTLSGSDYQFGIAQGANQPWYLRGVSDGGFRLHLNGTGDILTATSAGNVGINSPATNAKLEVVATSGEVFRADASGGAYRIVANQTGVSMNGNVGIGTSSPATTVEVIGASLGEYLRVGAGTVSDRSLRFSNFTVGGLAGVGHQINVPNANGVLTFATANTERARIDSDGAITATYNGATVFFSLGGTSSVNGVAGLPSNAGSPLALARDTGSLRSAHFAGNLKFDNGYGIEFGASSGGGATSTILDDYEEGTWTPSWAGLSTAGTPTGTFTGRYTKIGNVVTVWAQIAGANLTGAAGILVIAGLPFAPTAAASGACYLEGVTPTYTSTPPTGGGLSVHIYSSTQVAFKPSITTSWDNYLQANSTFTGGGGSTYGWFTLTYDV